MSGKIKLVAGVLTLAGLFCAWMYLQAAWAKMDRLEAEAAAGRVARLELAANAEALARREAERQALALENQKLKNDLRGLYETDEAAKAWGADCLPGAVCDRVRQSLSPGP